MNTPRRTTLPRTTAHLLTGALALSTTAPTLADIVTNTYLDDSRFVYVAYDMPDFDQQRLDDLPNHGVCHCVPTSSADLLAYVATHGYPEVDPGVPFLFDWSNQFNYDSATAIIDELGVAMAVSDGSGGSACGTTSNAALTELNNRISEDFAVNLRTGSYWGNDFGLAEMAAYNAANDAIGMLSYHRFTGAFDAEGVFQIGFLTGGHMVALNTLVALGGETQGLGVRDPGASLGIDAIQEDFATNFWAVSERQTAWGANTSTMALMGEVNPNTTLIRGITSYVAISPKGLLTWSPYTAARIELLRNRIPEWNPDFVPPQPIELDEHAWKIELLPDDIHLVVLSERGLNRVNRLTGKIDPLPLPFTDPVTDFAVDRFGDVWAAAGATLACIDPSGKVETIQMPAAVDALTALDPLGAAADRTAAPAICALMARHGLAARIQRTPDRHAVEFGSFPATKLSPEARFVATNDWAYLLDGGRLRTFKGSSSFSEVPTSGAPSTSLVDMGLDGETLILVDANHRGHAYRTGARLEKAANHPFHDADTKGRIAIKTSRSDAEPWNQIALESTVEDLAKDQAASEIRFECRSDLNYDGQVDGADMGVLFAAWGQGRSLADVNRDGVVDSADLGIMLADFGACR